jgi:archaellum component FlaG (FlaF/FlaG flagellin family)
MRANQAGAVLLVALIMLILVTIAGVSTASLIQDNTKVLQNFEARASVRSAALSALQEAIAYGAVVNDPGKPFLSPCDGFRTLCIDASGSESPAIGDDIEVTLGALKCISASIIRNEELDVFTSAADASCYQPGILSLCAQAVWEVEATAFDPVTGAATTVRQGLSTRTKANLISTACSGLSGGTGS